MRPDFVGIGAQKSATSWLFQCLRSHPDLFLPNEKELHFFSRAEVFSRGEEWYTRHFANAEGRTSGEISTSYLSSKVAPGRIHVYVPNVKLIVILRDPVDRAESHIRHLISRGELPRNVSLAEAIKRRPDIFENGCYGVALERYLACFHRSQLHVEVYESVCREPLALIQRIFSFLNVRTDVVPQSLHSIYNASSFRSSFLHGSINRTYFRLKAVPGWSLARKFLAVMGVTAPRVANYMARALRGTEKSLFLLSENERLALRNQYADDIRLLLRITGAEVQHWL